MKIISIFGTRPEAIKMAPLVSHLNLDKDIEHLLCVTGQHKEMLEQVLDLFAIKPDFNLDIMKQNQSLSQITGIITQRVEEIIKQEKPDRILVHGDTTTAFAASIAAFYNRIPVGHVEAGLRSFNINAPWPEEVNRRYVSIISDMHFAPTENSKANLLNEGVPIDNIFVTGNTVIDALHQIRTVIKNDPLFTTNFFKNLKIPLEDRKLVLVTAHRRENFGKDFQQICNAIKSIADRGDVFVLFPVHLNPNVQKWVNDILGDHPRIRLTKPLDYLSFNIAMNNADLIITDSGGIQEEAPSLFKPVLVTRNVTERQEALETGLVVLVGTNFDRIVSEANRFLCSDADFSQNYSLQNPFGDGKSAGRIVKHLLEKRC